MKKIANIILTVLAALVGIFAMGIGLENRDKL